MSIDLKLEISDRARKYSEQLQESMTLGEKGKWEIDKDRSEEIFAEGLPEGVDIKTVELVQDASIDFGVAHADAIAVKSLAAMKEDDELETTYFSSRVRGNRYDSTYVKKREGNAMGKPWVKYGTVSTDLVQGSGRRGGLNNVIKYHGEMAKSVFEK